MKKSVLVSALLASVTFSGVAFAADSHTNYVGSVAGLKDNMVIRDAEQVNDLIKYASGDAKIKLLKAFNEDGKLTAQEIKDSGISDHHFYTGYLAASTSQSQYDARLKEVNKGANMDDKFVSNRDLKAHGSMVMNQVDAGNAKQDARVDKIVSGLQDLGNHLQAQTPTLPPVENNNSGQSYDDTAIKGQVNTNTNNIQQIGTAVDKVAGAVSKNTTAIDRNTTHISQIGNYLKATAAENAREFARLDARIDGLEKKTDKLKAGVAGANAIGSLVQYMGTGTHHVAVAVGGYDGANALAGGYTYAFTKNTVMRGTLAYDSEGDFGYGVSVGHSW